MQRTRVRHAKVFGVLQSLHADSRLVRIVKRLTKEVERLDEDNAQLHAAVLMYKEVLRRHSAALIPGATSSNARAAGSGS